MTLDLDARAIWLGKHVLPHEPALRAWLRHRCPDGLDADDVIQETYTRLIATKSVEGIVNPRNYAFETAKSVIYTHLRRSRIVAFDQISEAAELLLPADDATPEDCVVDRDELKRIAGAISRLPAKVRRVFLMRRIEEKPQKQIASELGLSEGSVERLMCEALFILRNSIGRERKAPSQSSKSSKPSVQSLYDPRDRTGD